MRTVRTKNQFRTLTSFSEFLATLLFSFSKLLLQSPISVELKLVQFFCCCSSSSCFGFCSVIFLAPALVRHTGSPGDLYPCSPRPCPGFRPYSESSIDPCRGRNRH